VIRRARDGALAQHIAPDRHIGGGESPPNRVAIYQVQRSRHSIHWFLSCTRTREGVFIKMQDLLQREPKTSPEPSQREGFIARSIEQQTAKLPSDVFLWAAIGSMAGSLILTIAGAQK